ncbi:hypothetical protein NW752_001610 [Fusarium irregulare]|uniref:Uncharacterized protein n=1 Tax=Fusarium irregulare TaxID=2494466 RepID=A0A9W8PUW0_9HYPO|nr:hypothetical protein NW766_003770 [Fusarium irregulare]KAJ4026656.1 hypothetical protein NW752_001610 [Fusarium irregulare]
MCHQENLTPPASPIQEVDLPGGILEAEAEKIPCKCWCNCGRLVWATHSSICYPCKENCSSVGLQNSNEGSLDALVTNDSVKAPASQTHGVDLPGGIIQVANPQCQCICGCKRVVQDTRRMICNPCKQNCESDSDSEDLIAKDSVKDCPSD